MLEWFEPEWLALLPLRAIAAAGAGLIAVVLLIALLRRRALLRSALKALAGAGGGAAEGKTKGGGKAEGARTGAHGQKDGRTGSDRPEALRARLLSRKNVLRRLVRQKGDEVIRFFGLEDYLVERYGQKRRVEDARSILALVPASAGFLVLETACSHPPSAEVLRGWLKGQPPVRGLELLALSSKGKPFHPDAVLRLIDGHMADVPELTGHPEWPVRMFALRLMLASPLPGYGRALLEAFDDSNGRIRELLVRKCPAGISDDLFALLYARVLDDVSVDVRRAARARIKRDFPHRWTINPAELSAVQTVHILEQLDTDCPEDENTALAALQGSVPDCCFAAARFLEKSGTLERLFTSAHRGDMEDWLRRRRLLGCAVRAGVSSFLNTIRDKHSTAVRLLAAELLAEGGDVSLITLLAAQVFDRGRPLSSADARELYRSTVSLVCCRGNSGARKLLAKELRFRRRDSEVLGFILPLLPSHEPGAFHAVLRDFLFDRDFPADEALLDIMEQLPPPLFLGDVLDILELEDSGYSLKVRLRAMRILGRWKQDYTLQVMLENLSLVPRELRREFAGFLEAVDEEVLRERAALILASPDGAMREALISVLPGGAMSVFADDVRAALKDAEPEVRISCVQALAACGALDDSAAVLALLKDPVARVRTAAARVVGRELPEKFGSALHELLVSGEETEAVRLSALEGLAESGGREAVDILVRALEGASEMEGASEREGALTVNLRSALMSALARKTDEVSVAALVGHFQSAGGPLRKRLAGVFAEMGACGEEVLVGLLENGEAALQPVLADILSRSGFVNSCVRKLSHRKWQVRERAAELLGKMATPGAYRGIALASRDPSVNVRMKVAGAIEHLASPEGERILRALEEDADKNVRRCARKIRKGMSGDAGD